MPGMLLSALGAKSGARLAGSTSPPMKEGHIFVTYTPFVIHTHNIHNICPVTYVYVTGQIVSSFAGSDIMKMT